MKHADAYDFHADQLSSETLTKIDDFWSWFAEKAPALDAYFTTQGEQADTDPFEVMGRLNDDFPNLMWEFGPSDRGHKLIITAEWEDENRPLARAFKRRAPEFERWIVDEVRAPCELDTLIENFESRFQEKFCLSGCDAQISDNGRIDLNVIGKGNEDTLTEQGIKLATLILGEENDRDWLGYVSATPGEGGAGGLLSRLKRRKAPEFDAATAQAATLDAIDAAKKALPGEAYSATGLEDRGATLYKLGNMSDTHARPDLLTYMAPSETWANAVLHGGRFSSATHSAHGESFVYLKLPTQNETPWASSDRAEIEDIVHEALRHDDIGGVVAAGTGRDAAYIDVALKDVASGMARMAQALRNQPAAAKSSVHFMDPGLTDQAHPLLGAAKTMQ